MSFYQIVTKVSSIYRVSLTPEVRQVLSYLSIGFSVGLGDTTSLLQCMGLYEFDKQLLSWMVFPIGLMVVILLFSLAKLAVMRQLSLTALTTAVLPTLVRVLFLMYPLICNIAFEAFSCYEFDDGSRYLIADVRFDCNSDEYFSKVYYKAWIAIAVYPFGMIAVTALLLLKVREAVVKERPTVLSNSIRFLYKEYDVDYFMWELAEMTRRVVLVGVLVLVDRGSIYQITLGTVFCAVYLLLVTQAGPYRDTADDFLANASSFSMLVFFICCIIFKMAELSNLNAVQQVMSSEQKTMYHVHSLALSNVLSVCVIGSLAMTLAMLLVQLRNERLAQENEARNNKSRRLRHKHCNKEVEPPMLAMGDKKRFHIFLSHVWGTGQDQMRIVKQRLVEMMPNLEVFLDVDDLEEIGDLEGYIDRSTVILVYCSKGYFQSKNCMRELIAATSMKKAVVPLIDTDPSRGGLSLEEVRTQLVEAEGSYAKWSFDAKTTPPGGALYDHVFTTAPIEWNRIGHFQDITMRLIAECILPDDMSGKTCVDRELLSQKIKPLPPPKKPLSFHVYVSSLNPGADALMAEVANARKMRLKMEGRSLSRSTTSAAVTAAAQATNDTLGITRGKLLGTTSIHDLPDCEHMLLYLTGETWTRGEASEALAAEVIKALDADVHLLLAHEMPGVGQEKNHAVEFGTFFSHPDGATPEALLHRGIYHQIAVPLKGGPWREVSMALLGLMLGMSKEDVEDESKNGQDGVLGLDAGESLTYVKRVLRRVKSAADVAVQVSGRRGSVIVRRTRLDKVDLQAPSATADQGIVVVVEGGVDQMPTA